MLKVIILGAGNVAFHLTNELLKYNTIKVVQVYNKNIEKIEYLKTKTSITNSIKKLKEADIYIIAVSDVAISKISKKLNVKHKLVVHTSGGMDLNVLKSNSNKGVFYPLQTFSKEKKVDFSTIPICIEAETKNDLILLETLAKSISNNCNYITSKQRKSIHASAVFVNNFVNHLYYLGNKICDKSQVSFDILLPLIKETASKIENLSPFEAQTGPGKRNDDNTIKDHLKILDNNQQEIYKLLTKSIATTYGEKL